MGKSEKEKNEYVEPPPATAADLDGLPTPDSERNSADVKKAAKTGLEEALKGLGGLDSLFGSSEEEEK